MPMENRFITDRLILHPLTLTDTAFILDLLNSPGFINFIGDRQVRTIEGAKFYVEKIMANPDIQYWIVKLKDSSIAIGIITSIKRVYLDNPDIGFAFLPGFNQMGYAFEAAGSVLKALLSTEDNKFILATTTVNNTKSQKLLEKLGLKSERRIIVEGEELILYRIAAAE
jgi:ribosomal-protein-alanine N-acetyltransferase